MFKFGTIGAFKQVRNNPRCKASAELKNGYVVIVNEGTGVASAPASAEEAKGSVWVVNNIIDKPEIRSKSDFKIEAGEPVRAFLLEDLKGLPVELSADVVSGSYDAVAKGDVLVSAGDGSGQWVKADGTTVVADEYLVSIEIVEKSTFGGKGIYGVVQVG